MQQRTAPMRSISVPGGDAKHQTEMMMLTSEMMRDGVRLCLVSSCRGL